MKNPLEPKDVVKNWMRTRITLEYFGLWEKLKNLRIAPQAFFTIQGT